MAFGAKRQQRQSHDSVGPTEQVMTEEAILDLPDRELMSVLPTLGWLGGGLLSGVPLQSSGAAATPDAPRVEPTP